TESTIIAHASRLVKRANSHAASSCDRLIIKAIRSLRTTYRLSFGGSWACSFSSPSSDAFTASRRCFFARLVAITPPRRARPSSPGLAQDTRDDEGDPHEDPGALFVAEARFPADAEHVGEGGDQDHEHTESENDLPCAHRAASVRISASLPRRHTSARLALSCSSAARSRRMAVRSSASKSLGSLPLEHELSTCPRPSATSRRWMMASSMRYRTY